MHKMPKMTRFPVSVPVALHRKFKLKCVGEGVMMSEVVRAWLERECADISVPAPKTKPARSTPRENATI